MKRLHLALLGIAAFSPFAHGADPATIDWSQIPSRTVTLFYPGQSTFQWLRGDAHPGAQSVAGGEACVTCHKGQESKLGGKTVKGGPLEPTAPTGKKGALPLRVQVAYDEQNAYFRFQWKTNNDYPGDGYPYYRFNGTEWKSFGAPRLSAPAYKGEQPALYEDRISLLIDDGRVPGFAQQGCWVTCHNGERDNPKQPSAAEVAANPFYQAIKRADVRKYLPLTRTDAAASWDKGVSIGELEKLKAEGKFLDLVQWRAHRSNPVGMADDGYVLEWRNFDAGANPFGSNMDAKTKLPRYMFDPAQNSGQAAFNDQLAPKHGAQLLIGKNAVPFDPKMRWKIGDTLPQYWMSAEAAKGSAADNRNAKGVWKNGTWTVVLTRPLNLKNPDDKALTEGGVYTMGFAVHDDNITTRGHHVSFPLTVGFGAKADIRATKLK